jgi:hypothetical protein
MNAEQRKFKVLTPLFSCPEAVHFGPAPGILVARQRTLDQAFARHPERFVRNTPAPRDVPQGVWINPPQMKPDRHVAPGTTIIRPVDPQVVVPANRFHTEVTPLTKKVRH